MENVGISEEGKTGHTIINREAEMKQKGFNGEGRESSLEQGV